MGGVLDSPPDQASYWWRAKLDHGSTEPGIIVPGSVQSNCCLVTAPE